LAYSVWSVIFGETPSSSKWNILGANDASLRDGTGILINNNQAIQAAQAGGSAKDLIKLATDDILRLSQVRTQTDNSDSIASATSENILLQLGWGQIIGVAATSMQETVTFPTAFGTILGVVVSLTAAKSTPAASAITGLDTEEGGGAGWSVSASDITTSNFNLTYARNTGNFSASIYYGYSWIAWGTKS